MLCYTFGIKNLFKKRNMSLFFQKKRGRPAKNAWWIQTKKMLSLGLATVSGAILLLLFFVLWSFSSLLFLIPKSFDLLGMSEPKTYLVTLHNEGELRAELGFFTGFLFVEMDKGHMTMEFHDSYDIKAPEKSQKILAPDIIEKRFSSDSRYQGWVFRDANFSPLHPQNAQNIQKFLEYDNRYKNKKIDAVISLDLYAIGQVIDAVGGVEFSGKKYTSHNIFSVLETEAKTFDRHSKKEWLERKSSLQPLAKAIIKEVALSPFSWKSFSNEIEKLGKEKHFHLWFADSNIQNTFKEKSWTGDFPEISENTFLMGHNFSNLGGKKGDRYIQKNFTSLFSISPKGKISEKLTLRVQHQGTRTLNSDRYFAYVRLFRPAGTTLDDFTGEFDETPEKVAVEKKSLPRGEEFTFFFHLDESSEKTFSFDFTVPKRIDSKNQKFLLFAQSGKIEKTDTNTLIFQAEGDSSFTVSGCDEVKNLENISRCEVFTAGDKMLKISQNADEKVPVFEEVVILDEGKTVRLQFSENIQEVYPSEVLVQEKISGNKRRILDLKTEPRALVLTFQNPLTPKKLYTVHVDSIVDTSGNAITPFRMTVKKR